MQRLFEILRDSRIMYASVERFLRAVLKVALVQQRWEPQPGVQRVQLKPRSTGKAANMTVFEGEEEAYLSKTAAEMNEGEEGEVAGFMDFRLFDDGTGAGPGAGAGEGHVAQDDEDEDEDLIGPRRPPVSVSRADNALAAMPHDSGMATDLGDVSHTASANVASQAATTLPGAGQAEASRASANAASLARDVAEAGAGAEAPAPDGGGSGHDHPFSSLSGVGSGVVGSAEGGADSSAPGRPAQRFSFNAAQTGLNKGGRGEGAQSSDGDSPMDLGDDAGLGSSVPLQSASSRSPEDDGEKGAVRRRPAAADTDAMDVDEAPPAKSPRMQAPGES